MINWTEPPINELRADWAHAALTAYQRVTKAESETIFVDMLADFFHFADRHGVDIVEAFNDAAEKYRGDMEDGPKVKRKGPISF